MLQIARVRHRLDSLRERGILQNALAVVVGCVGVGGTDWLRGRHAQTVFGTLFRPGPRPPVRRERWELSDGDFLDVDRMEGPAAAPLLVVLHGLEGSSSSHYVRGLLAQARARGWRWLTGG